MTAASLPRLVFAGVCLAVVVALAGCGLWGGDDENERFVRPGEPRTSPSGQFTASVVDGPPQNGVATWIVVVTDRSGVEVFRDGYAYSTRQGVGVTWLSNRDQLWILSSDVGTAYVEQRDGRWQKTAITPQTRNQVPEEIDKLR